MKTMNCFYRSVTVLVLLLLTLPLQAGNFTFSTADIGTLMHHATPNAAGVSINKVNTLNISAVAGINLLNAAALNNNLSTTGEADTIILQALSAGNNAVNLKGKIEVIGKAADVVIVAPPLAQITCDGCSFRNIPRIIIATGTLEYDAAGNLKNINSADGLIEVTPKGLDGQGAQFVDLLSQNIYIDGNVITNLRGDRNSNGTIQIDPKAKKTIAAGRVSVMLGNNQYQYDTGLATVLSNNANVSFRHSRNATISAGQILIASTSTVPNIWIQGWLVTHTNFTLAGIYRGENVIPDRSIRVSAAGNLLVNGKITSNHLVNLQAGTTLNVLRGIVQAGDLKATAVYDIYNSGIITGKNIAYAGRHFKNFNQIKASNELFVSASHTIINYDGGLMDAKTIGLHSPTGRIFNGYNTNGLVKAPSSTRTIISAEDIDIQAKQFANINRYVAGANTPWQFYVDRSLDEVKSNAVLMTAKNRLNIKATARIDNKSAMISASGSLVLDAPVIYNAREKLDVASRAGTEYPIDLCVAFKACVLRDNVKVKTSITDQYLTQLAPAGRILTKGNAVMQSDHFINSYSFFDVHNDLTVNVKKVTQLGRTLNKRVKVNKVTTTVVKKKRSFLGGHENVSFPDTKNTQHDITTGKIPALMAVGGNIIGQGTGHFNLKQEIQ